MHNRAFAELQIAVITRRQRQQLFDLGARRGNAGVGRAHQFDHVGIALVRHDRTAGGVLRRQCNKCELGAGEQTQIPGKTTQVQQRGRQGFDRRHLELAARQLRIRRRHLQAAEAQRFGDMIAIQRQIHPVTGGAAERIGIDPCQRIARALRVVDEAFGPRCPPHAQRRHHRALQMRVARQRQRLFGLCARQRDLRAFGTQGMQTRKTIFQPQPRRHQNLVVAAAAGVDLAARIAEAFDQSRFDRRMAVLEACVQHEIVVAEIFAKVVQFDLDGCELIGSENADPQQAFGMRATGFDVEQQELAIEDHVLASEERLDACIDFHAGFLPKQVGHRKHL